MLFESLSHPKGSLEYLCWFSHNGPDFNRVNCFGANRLDVPPSIIDCHVALGAENHLRLEVNDYLQQMRMNGIQLALARPLGAELAVLNGAGNDRILNAAPSILALVTANPWFGILAIEEMHRCAQAGAVGLYLHPTRQGFMPTDPIVEPLLQVAADLHWPVVVHTGTYIMSDVLAVAEVARRYPQTTFVCDCAGFSDMWFELAGVIGETANLVFCASLIWPRAIGNTIRNFGPEKVLFGSGEPRDRLGAALRRCDRLELSVQERTALFSGNARRVFHLP